MADRLRHYSTSKYETKDMGQVVDDLMSTAKNGRRAYERRWYENNFFDDGYHFRYLSRTENKIVDLSERRNLYDPLRAIPKASRQIRGIANLIMAQDPVPVVYPEKVAKINYPNETQQVNPQTGQMEIVPDPEYTQA